MLEPLQAIIIEDTAVYRKIMNIVLEKIDGINVIGEFSNGKSGLEGIQRLRPDIVFLDIEMPEMNGLEVLNIVKRDFSEINVIVVSSADQTQADITVKALQSGALDFVSKPINGSINENVKILSDKIRPLINVCFTRKNLSNVKRITQKLCSEEKAAEHIPVPAPKLNEKAKESGISRQMKIDLVAIGTSTGGPYALGEVIPKLPADFPLPVVIVQHMPPNFTASLAKSLSRKSNLQVKEAEEGERLEPGRVYLAPGGHHMVLKRERDRIYLGLEDSPPQHGCRPSVDVLFKSIAENFDGNVLAVIMTGMGSDGTDGVRALKNKNCYCLIQDEASCVVYGMPKVVYENNLSDEVVSLRHLGERIVSIVKNKTK